MLHNPYLVIIGILIFYSFGNCFISIILNHSYIKIKENLASKQINKRWLKEIKLKRLEWGDICWNDFFLVYSNWYSSLKGGGCKDGSFQKSIFFWWSNDFLMVDEKRFLWKKFFSNHFYFPTRMEVDSSNGNTQSKDQMDGEFYGVTFKVVCLLLTQSFLNEWSTWNWSSFIKWISAFLWLEQQYNLISNKSLPTDRKNIYYWENN